VICPLSVVRNWEAESARFTPLMRVAVHHGTGRSDAATFANVVAQHDLIITTYHVAARDIATLDTVQWTTVVFDEAQAVKNPETRTAKALRTLPAERRKQFRRDVQAVFQDPYEVYNPFYRVDHVLTTPVAKFRLAATRAEGRGLIEDALRAVGLRPEEILGRFPHQLSGGQRQRVMVARALLLRPHLIVADEPVSMVDASLRATILESLWRLRHEAGMSLIYVTHDLTTAYQVADSVMVMRGGTVVEEGDVEQVIRAPAHPYTQELVAAVPPPDPTIDWGLEDEAA
jgi:ABC-type glutathione transport system ATPase component